MNLITTEEAAKRVFTTPYTIRKYIRQGKLLGAKFGKQYLIRESDLESLLEKMFGISQSKGE